MDVLTYRCLRFIYVTRKWLVQQFTPAGLGVLGGGIGSAIASLGSTRSMCHILFFFAFALLILATIGSRLIQFRFKATRLLPRFGTVGEPFPYQVVIQNLSPQPQKGLKLVETFAAPFPSFREFIQIKRRYPVGNQWRPHWRRYLVEQQWAKAHLQDLPPLSTKGKTKAMVEILPLRRGSLHLETITLACPDPLGLIYKHHTYDVGQSLCILPQRYQLLPLNLSQASQYQSGETLRTSAVGEALEFRSLRDYRAGDPTNKIHWKSWAKVGRPIVKEQQDETAIHNALILDTFQLEPHSPLFEEAIAVAISFLMQEQPEASLLDVIYAAADPRLVTVGKGLRQRAQIIETVATLNPNPHRELECLNPILQSRLSRLSGCFCILLGFDDTRYAFLKMLSQYGIPIKAICLSDLSLHMDPQFQEYFGPQCQLHSGTISNLQQELLAL